MSSAVIVIQNAEGGWGKPAATAPAATHHPSVRPFISQSLPASSSSSSRGPSLRRADTASLCLSYLLIFRKRLPSKVLPANSQLCHRSSRRHAGRPPPPPRAASLTCLLAANINKYFITMPLAEHDLIAAAGMFIDIKVRWLQLQRPPTAPSCRPAAGPTRMTG